MNYDDKQKHQKVVEIIRRRMQRWDRLKARDFVQDLYQRSELRVTDEEYESLFRPRSALQDETVEKLATMLLASFNAMSMDPDELMSHLCTLRDSLEQTIGMTKGCPTVAVCVFRGSFDGSPTQMLMYVSFAKEPPEFMVPALSAVAAIRHVETISQKAVLAVGQVIADADRKELAISISGPGHRGWQQTRPFEILPSGMHLTEAWSPMQSHKSDSAKNVFGMIPELLENITGQYEDVVLLARLAMQKLSITCSTFTEKPGHDATTNS